MKTNSVSYRWSQLKEFMNDENDPKKALECMKLIREFNDSQKPFFFTAHDFDVLSGIEMLCQKHHKVNCFDAQCFLVIDEVVERAEIASGITNAKIAPLLVKLKEQEELLVEARRLLFNCCDETEQKDFADWLERQKAKGGVE